MSDQAQELRRMFAESGGQRYTVIASLSRPAMALPIAASACRDLAAEGVDTLWIDDLPLAEREDWPIARASRFSLEQVRRGFVPLDRAIAESADGVRYIHSGATTQDTDSWLRHGVGGPLPASLADDLGFFQRILITTTEGNLITPADHPIETDMLVVSGAGVTESNDLILWMVRAEANFRPKKWGLILVGDLFEGNRSWEELSPLCKRYLSGEVDLISAVDGRLDDLVLAGSWVPDKRQLLRFLS